MSWTSWVWIALGVLAALIAVVVITGALLPVGHAAARRVRLQQPPAVVWAALVDVDALPQWRPDLQRVERLPDRGGAPCWREVSKFGPMELCAEVREPGRRLVTRIVTPKSPFGGTWTWELAADGDGTVVTITESGEVYNVVFRALSRFVFGHTATIDAVLGALGRKFGQRGGLEDAPPAPAPPRPAGTGACR